jgi:hypothetical protein
MKRIFLFLNLILCITNLSQGQSEENRLDSLLQIKKVAPAISTYENIANNTDSFAEMPDVLPQIQRQVQTRRDYISYQDLGTHFSPLFNLAEVYSEPIGFRPGNNSLNAYTLAPKMRLFYNAPMAFTRFRYTQGADGYIQFDALHTQNIIPTWNIAAGIQSFTNKGVAIRQLQVHRSPYFTTHFTHPNQKLKVIGSFNWTRRSGYVNGGLNPFDSTALQDVNTNQIEIKSFADIYNLVSPGVERNSLDMGLANAADTVKISNHIARIQYQIGPKHFDSMDSLTVIKPILALFYEINYQNQNWVHEFDANDALFYNKFFNQTASNFLRDSIAFRMADQRIGFNKFLTKDKGIGIKAFAGIQNGTYIQNDNVKYVINNLYTGGSVALNLPGNIYVKSNAQLFLSGYNGGDYLLNASLTKPTKQLILMAGIMSGLNEAAPQQKAFVSPYTNLINRNLKKTNHNKILGSISWIKPTHPLHVSLSIQNTGNLIYYNNAIRLIQSAQAVQQTKLTIAKLLNYKSFNVKIDAFAQQISGNSDIELPNWGLKTDLYFRKNISDSALDFKAGLDIFIHDRYNALGYAPLIRQFYYKAGTETGGYPLLDFYISGKIKTFIFFAKMENLLDFYFVQRRTESFSTYRYPMQPTAFRLGFKWDFFL